MQLAVDLNYRGACEPAFRFYEQHLGGRITGLVRHGDQPNPHIPADWQDKVLHARIEIASTGVMGADIANSEPMRSAYLSLTVAAARSRASGAWRWINRCRVLADAWRRRTAMIVILDVSRNSDPGTRLYGDGRVRRRQ